MYSWCEKMRLRKWSKGIFLLLWQKLWDSIKDRLRYNIVADQSNGNTVSRKLYKLYITADYKFLDILMKELFITLSDWKVQTKVKFQVKIGNMKVKRDWIEEAIRVIIAFLNKIGI